MLETRALLAEQPRETRRRSAAVVSRQDGHRRSRHERRRHSRDEGLYGPLPLWDPLARKPRQFRRGPARRGRLPRRRLWQRHMLGGIPYGRRALYHERARRRRGQLAPLEVREIEHRHAGKERGGGGRDLAKLTPITGRARTKADEHSQYAEAAADLHCRFERDQRVRPLAGIDAKAGAADERYDKQHSKYAAAERRAY